MTELSGEEKESLLNLLADLEPTLRTVKKLQDSGIMAVLDALADQSDNLFNYASTMELLGAASAAVKLVPVLSQAAGEADSDEIQDKLSRIPWKTLFRILSALLEFVATDFTSIKPPEGRTRTMQVLSEVRSPEMEYMLRLVRAVSLKIMQEMKIAEKP